MVYAIVIIIIINRIPHPWTCRLEGVWGNQSWSGRRPVLLAAHRWSMARVCAQAPRNGGTVHCHSGVSALLADTTNYILPCRTERGLPLVVCPGLVQGTCEITQLVLPMVCSRGKLLESARARTYRDRLRATRGARCSSPPPLVCTGRRQPHRHGLQRRHATR